MTPIPTRPEHITADWLTRFLAPRTRRPVEGLEILGSTQGAATRWRVKPTYAPDAMVASRVLFIKTSLTRRMLVADPHMYVTEVKFYEQIHPTLKCETPEVYAWALDEQTKRFAVVIEDLSLRDAVFPTALSGLTADDVAPLISNLAKLHAPHWGQPTSSDLSMARQRRPGRARSGGATAGEPPPSAELQQPYKRLRSIPTSIHSIACSKR